MIEQRTAAFPVLASLQSQAQPAHTIVGRRNWGQRQLVAQGDVDHGGCVCSRLCIADPAQPLIGGVQFTDV
jgi:hypothetical protein